MPERRELTSADARALTDLYEDYDWWADRDIETVRRALAETDIAVGVADGNRLVAAARVMTDFAYYATVFDVIVAVDRRGEGIGTTLMQGIVEHPALQNAPRISLQCREGLVPYYQSVGFEVFDSEIDVPAGGSEGLVQMTYDNSA